MQSRSPNWRAATCVQQKCRLSPCAEQLFTTSGTSRHLKERCGYCVGLGLCSFGQLRPRRSNRRKSGGGEGAKERQRTRRERERQVARSLQNESETATETSCCHAVAKKTDSLRKTALATAERSTLRFFVLRGPTRRYQAGAHIHCITIRHTRKRCVCQRNSPSGRLTSNFRHVKGRVCG